MTNIIQHGEDKVLRETSDPVSDEEFNSDKLQEIIERMRSALHDTQDGVAIAAPQIGVSKRIFLVRDAIFKGRNDMSTKDQEFINPQLINTSQETVTFDEGCLSVRNTYGKVTRHKQATVEAQKVNGNAFTIGGSGLLAQIFQHEIEHLEGTLFIDKARNLRSIDPEKRPNVNSVDKHA